MKHLLLLGSFFLTAILSAEDIPLNKWSIPAEATRSGTEIIISSGGKKHGELMWAPFFKVEKNKVWQIKATITGQGEIQASSGCYSVDKKRFITRYPFAEGTKKIHTDTPREEIWYLTLPKNQESIGWIRPALRIISGKFAIRQIKIEAFEQMPFIEENLPLAKFSLPASAKRNDTGISATNGNKKNGELLWGPFRPVGNVKVWQVSIEFVGRGDIQASLGCYDQTKKRFITRYPFADGNREVNTVTPKTEVWYLVLPKKSENIKWVRPTIRIISGEFSIRNVHIKELKELPQKKKLP